MVIFHCYVSSPEGMSCLAHLHHRVDMCRSRMSKQQQFEILGAFLAEATCMLAVLAVLVLPVQGAKAWVLGVVGMGLAGYLFAPKRSVPNVAS